MSSSLYSDLIETINTQQKIILALMLQLSSIFSNSKTPKTTDMANLDYQN